MRIEKYPDADMMAIDVANALADDLNEALHQRDRALLAVAGGTTPGPVFDDLCAVDLDWSRVDVVLTDERWVPEDHERSNARLIKERLLTARAARARFIPLFAPANTPEEVLPQLEAQLAGSLPISVALLGMGADMHTASLFPDGEGLEDALANDAPILLPMRHPKLPDTRVTFSARVLDAAWRKHILIKGDEKMLALEAAKRLEDHEAPIRSVWSDATVHWAG